MDVTDLGAATAFAPGVPPGSTVWDMPDDDTMLQQISAMLQQLCDHNAAHLGACPTIFDSDAPPLLLPSVHCFLVRIHCYTEFDSVCFLVALSYIIRLWGEHGPSLRPTTHNIHRLFIAALVVASKTNDDTFHPNRFMAKCGGITNAELNKLEVDLCERLRWDLAVQPDELIALTSQLMGDVVSIGDDDASALLLDSPV